MTREKIGIVHAVLYTHSQADHLLGRDDLRIGTGYLQADVPIYCEKEVEQVVRTTFAYAFDPVARTYPAGGVPRLAFHTIRTEPFELLGVRVTPIRLLHGYQPTLGYRFGDVAYCTDVKEIPPDSLSLLEGLDVLILDCLRDEPHLTHMNVEEALAVIARLRPKRALFTHISHRLEHEATSRRLPPGVELAYDGLRIPLRPEVWP